MLLCTGTNERGKHSRADCDGLCRIVCLVDSNQGVCQLKHVITQTNDKELGILGPLLNVVGNNADVAVVKSSVDLQ